jgi:hypothetical protein
VGSPDRGSAVEDVAKSWMHKAVGTMDTVTCLRNGISH